MTGAGRVELRDVEPSDLPIFFDYQRDRRAAYMAAFTVADPDNRSAFFTHWAHIMSDPSIQNRTILVDGNVAGHLATFIQFGEREVSYWIDAAYWGRGVATRALAQFVERIETRPLHARAAKDNVASIRVLEKCGFRVTGHDEGYANARGSRIEELIFKLP